MKRLQIMIEEELDRALERRARRERVSKAALLRQFARQALEPLPPLEEDSIATMIGADDYEPADIDSVVYR